VALEQGRAEQEAEGFLLAESDQAAQEAALDGYSLERCWRDYRLSMLLVALIPMVVLPSLQKCSLSATRS
jgi:hypothetical protein